MAPSQRPDVVPGNAIESAAMFHKPMASSLKYPEFDDENSSISALNQGKTNRSVTLIVTGYSEINI